MTQRSSGQKRWIWAVLFAATVVLTAIGVGWHRLSSPRSALSEGFQGGLPKAQRLPDDLVGVSDAKYASLKGLAPGSQEAQERQRQAVQQLGLPLEVKTRKTGILLRLVPAGSFTMGSPKAEQDVAVMAGIDREWVQNETEHQVTLSKAFYCGKFEVTQPQWRAVMGSNPSYFKDAGQDAPVGYVSWDGCRAFVKNLCEMEGVPEGTYRLLTEAEWEYSCRAGTQTAFCYGNDLDSSMANFDGDRPYGGGRKGVNRQMTLAVGSFRPNAWGLYDMHGNVWEWCQDRYDTYRGGAVTDPLGPASGDLHVVRGGAWGLFGVNCRSACRDWCEPVLRFLVGLRVARITPSYTAAGLIPQAGPTVAGSAAEPVKTPSVEPESVALDKVVGSQAKGMLTSLKERERQTVVPKEVATSRGIPADLIEVADAQYTPLDGLALGSVEAREWQREAVQQLGLPLEVKARKTGMVFRLVPARSFTMGSPTAEQDAMVKAGLPLAFVDHEAEHQVTLSKMFYCGKFEVTQGQWEQVMGSNPSEFKNAGKDAPVEQVTWDDCEAFVKKLCQMEGVLEGTYRLLAEAEWEYACRAGTRTPLYDGDLVIEGLFNVPSLDLIAWYAGNSGVDYEGAWDSSRWPEKQYHHRQAGTHPVGGKHANGFGLCDMIGNVWEWCQDRYGEYPSGVATDPLGPASGDYRVFRGGSWCGDAKFCRSAHRGWNSPGYRDLHVGLRLARATPTYR